MVHRRGHLNRPNHAVLAVAVVRLATALVSTWPSPLPQFSKAWDFANSYPSFSPGQAVYDPFLGSGTSIAAETTARVCLAIEIVPLYVDVAIQKHGAMVKSPTGFPPRTGAALGLGSHDWGPSRVALSGRWTDSGPQAVWTEQRPAVRHLRATCAGREAEQGR